MMVNQEHMQQWIDALRSGRYAKVKGALETDAGNCAVGVACREAIKAGVNMECWTDLTGFRTGVTMFDGFGFGTPDKVKQWLGVDDDLPIFVKIWGSMDTVSNANDSGMPFADIADGLYEYYLKEPTDG